MKSYAELAADLFRQGYEVGHADAKRVPMDQREAFREVLAAWTAKRAEWIKQRGGQEGFAEWFSEQVGAVPSNNGQAKP